MIEWSAADFHALETRVNSEPGKNHQKIAVRTSKGYLDFYLICSKLYLLLNKFQLSPILSAVLLQAVQFRMSCVCLKVEVLSFPNFINLE